MSATNFPPPDPTKMDYPEIMIEEGSQMDPVKLKDGEGHLVEMPVDRPCFQEPSCAKEINEDTRVHPRLGDEYQAEIPSLATEKERMELRSSPVVDSSMLGFEYPVAVGLAIPVTWTQNTSTRMEDECRGFSGHNSCAQSSEDEHNNHSSGNTTRNLTQHSIYPERLGSKVEYDEQCVKSSKSAGQNMQCLQEHKDYVPLPGMPMYSWSDEEAQTFLLGLYIFGKNLVQVKKFMNSKTMGEVQSYYYGEFFRSDGYKRWDACRKVKGRKCILGSRIFSGPRQQELLSRLLAAVTREARDALLEVFKTYNEGASDFEQFILCLRSTVGAQVLVEAVGIGKGKYDLTGFPLEPSRNHGVSARAEIPIRKVFSSLSSGDIIKYLTGDFRLSKAKSNDLFWEAIWPRLLAKGWHSEKPKDSSLIGKRDFVFLIPGVKKFSRKKLVKGNHYFDSASDVLRKVASEPRLLGFGVEIGHNEGGARPENGWVHNVEPSKSALHDKKPPWHVRPSEPGCSADLMKFTVVDTSFVQGEEPCIARSRNLPAVTNHGYTSSPHSGDSGSGNSEELSDSEDSSESSEDLNLNTNKRKTDASCVNERKRKPPAVDMMDGDAISKIRSTINGHSSSDQIFNTMNNACSSTATVIPVDNQGVHCTNSSTDQRVHPNPQGLLAPVSKRRLVSCKNERAGRKGTAVSKRNPWKQADTPPQHVPKANEASAGANPFVRSVNSWTNRTLDIHHTYSRQLKDVPNNNVETTSYKEKAQRKLVIDLNMPPMLSDYESTANYIVPPSDNNTPMMDRPILPPQETKEMDGCLLEMNACSNVVLGEQLSLDSRRPSTRSRLPTTRALEALAGGFMGTEQNGDDANFPSSNRSSIPVQQPPRRSTDFVAPLSSQGKGSSSRFTNPAIVVDEQRMSNPQDHSAPSDRSSAKVTRQFSANETICSCHRKMDECE